MALTIRSATPADAPRIARHRAEMYRDMGVLPDALYAQLVDAARPYLEHALAAGTYRGWLAHPSEQPEEVVSGVGLTLRPLMPRPGVRGDATVILGGMEGLVVNVFTERAWRRKGVAKLLMEHLLEWTRANQLARVVLHASTDGRPLYEQLGFVQSNEMRYEGD